MQGWASAIGAAGLVMAAASCSPSVGGTDDTLSPLSPTETTALTAVDDVTAVDDDPARGWYLANADDVGRHRRAIDDLLARLETVDVPSVRIATCRDGRDIEEAARTSTQDARRAHPEWERALDLARWMLTRCVDGDLASVTTILPDLRETLDRFDAWRSVQPAAAGRSIGRRPCATSGRRSPRDPSRCPRCPRNRR